MNILFVTDSRGYQLQKYLDALDTRPPFSYKVHNWGGANLSMVRAYVEREQSKAHYHITFVSAGICDITQVNKYPRPGTNKEDRQVSYGFRNITETYRMIDSFKDLTNVKFSAVAPVNLMESKDHNILTNKLNRTRYTDSQLQDMQKLVEKDILLINMKLFQFNNSNNFSTCPLEIRFLNRRRNHGKKSVSFRYTMASPRDRTVRVKLLSDGVHAGEYLKCEWLTAMYMSVKNEVTTRVQVQLHAPDEDL